MCFGKSGILDPRVLRGQLFCAFMSISVLTHVVYSQWSFLARAAKRHRGVNPMMAPMNPFLASMFGPAFALLVPTRADRDRWDTLLNVTNNDMGSWCAFFVSCCQTSGTAWPVLSKQDLQIKQNELNMVKPIWMLFFYVYLFEFNYAYFLFYIFASFYFYFF